MSESINQKIIFWGSPLFALPSLQRLDKLSLVKAVVTQPDRPIGRSKKLVPTPIKQYALEHNLPTLEPEKLDEDFIAELKKYLPAVFLVIAYGKIIPQTILDLSEIQSINIHPSKLPILRGPSPIQTALLEGFDTTAVSLMQIDEKMDHGPILSQIEAKIEHNDDYNSLSERLSVLSADLLEDSMVKYLNGDLQVKAQDDSQATFCKMIKKEDGLIDWQKSAKEIYNQIRAFSAWPSTFSNFNGLDVKIKQAKIVEMDLEPKEIVIIDDRLIIGTGKQSLEIIKIQPSGKMPMSAAEFIRGYKDKI